VRGARAALLCARLQTHCCKRSFDARGHLARRQPEASQAESDVCPGRRHDDLVVRVLEDKRARCRDSETAAPWAEQAAAHAQQRRLAEARASAPSAAARRAERTLPQPVGPRSMCSVPRLTRSVA
jgi:hypothetical protein